MSLLNAKCILLAILVGVAGWDFPWGIVVDGGILAAWIALKRKRVPGSMQGQRAGIAAPTQSNDAFNALAAVMLSDKVAGATDAAAKELGIHPSKARQPARTSGISPKDADIAYKIKLLD
ncbi:MAG TPA: hypothetical protein VKM55_14385 [Candidatus Lokiarchaeia archaeon]|nr:hypothetical protein [Candidatus Lokiarchaeia archaeon]